MGSMHNEYLMVENPGVAPESAFTLLGASTKREDDTGKIIGKFGTGNKHFVTSCLRAGLYPVAFRGTDREEFNYVQREEDTGMGKKIQNIVTVKLNQKKPRDLGFVLEHGSVDWNKLDFGLREVVSNALDRAVAQGEYDFQEAYKAKKPLNWVEKSKNKHSEEWEELENALGVYRTIASDYQKVVVRLVSANQVRAKAGHTRVFVPASDEVKHFYANLNKWFLHFQEPELLNREILPKKNRNLGDSKSAVIYRRGVRIREIRSSIESLFDFNLEQLELKEDRNADDWSISYVAAKSMANANVDQWSQLWQSFLDGRKVWEHDFEHYGLEDKVHSEEQKEIWKKAFDRVAGEDAVLATMDGGKMVSRKGFKVVVAPEKFVNVAQKYGIRTPASVLSEDEKSGRQIFDATSSAQLAVDFIWDLCEKHSMTNGKKKPLVKTFRKIMDAGSQLLGFYKDNVVYLNLDIATEVNVTNWKDLSHQLLTTTLEEVAHHASGAGDFSRDLQDWAFNMVMHVARG